MTNMSAENSPPSAPLDQSLAEADAPAIADKLCDIGVEHQRHLVTLFKLLAVLLAETHRRALDQLHPSYVIRNGLVLFERNKLQNVMRLVQKRLDVRPSDRPAGIRHVRLGFKIHRVQHAAPACPMVRRAAETAQPRRARDQNKDRHW